MLLNHALRNALLPVVTIVGLQFGSLLSGAIVTEKIFARPGLGTLLLEGIRERQLSDRSGNCTGYRHHYVGVKLGVDLLYGTLDPTHRRGGTR